VVLAFTVSRVAFPRMKSGQPAIQATQPREFFYVSNSSNQTTMTA
jgi:hypothetical protein